MPLALRSEGGTIPTYQAPRLPSLDERSRGLVIQELSTKEKAIHTCLAFRFTIYLRELNKVIVIRRPERRVQ